MYRGYIKQPERGVGGGIGDGKGATVHAAIGSCADW